MIVVAASLYQNGQRVRPVASGESTPCTGDRLEVV
jgi:hypothetical protein